MNLFMIKNKNNKKGNIMKKLLKLTVFAVSILTAANMPAKSVKKVAKHAIQEFRLSQVMAKSHALIGSGEFNQARELIQDALEKIPSSVSAGKGIAANINPVFQKLNGMLRRIDGLKAAYESAIEATS